ncbi:tripeptidyl peptidase-like protein [Polychaeton citri CBS 116435]|uniref:tripeptidyl-peptidase II n=1 Tax=Polychaeton citri CBS 116435 TaxID=1314669 RepID=A0A9P4Q1F9_9PEZI|nr:tripeptidyl peptidase-like protein [Polychaeton citri CBS 116435]
MKFCIAAFAALAAATPIVPRDYEYAVKESHPIPKRWVKVAKAPADHVLRVDIGLRQDRFEQLERELYEVSDPDHQRYGAHLSQEDVHELIKPSSKTSELIHDWLFAHDIEAEHLSYSGAKDWVTVHLPVSKIEEMLQTEYHVFQHEDGSFAVRAPEWSLPVHLHEHVDMISPTNSFFRPTAKKSGVKPVEFFGRPGHGSADWAPAQIPQYPDVSSVCNTSLVTPLCLRTYYGTYDYTPQVPGKSKVALCNYLGESNNRSDTRIFLNKYRPEAVSEADSFKFVSIDGGPTYQTLNDTLLEAGTDLEGNLDVQTIIGIDYPIPLTAYSTGGEPPFIPDLNTPTNTNEPYLSWVNYVLSQSADTLPQAISTSYGDDEQSIPKSYATRVCNSFAQLGVRGVSLFFSSGDSGVGDNGTCISNDGKDTPMFIPSFPADCPYITSVGGTKNFAPEVVAYDARNGYAGGGGFSNYFPTPSYQKKEVSEYVESLNGLYDGLYNKNGRGYPDVAAQGQLYSVVWNGTFVRLDGTSASCPTTTAIFALVNDALLAAGKPTLGFLNPLIYKKLKYALNDITEGSAIGCDVAGFPAQKGWDAVSGYGTPMFPKIIKSLLGHSVGGPHPYGYGKGHEGPQGGHGWSQGW